MTGLIAVRDRHDRSLAFAAGRVWQRLHLSATLASVAMQPLIQSMEVVDRDRQLGPGSAWEARLAALTGGSEWQPNFSFRAGMPTQPAARAGGACADLGWADRDHPVRARTLGRVGHVQVMLGPARHGTPSTGMGIIERARRNVRCLTRGRLSAPGARPASRGAHCGAGAGQRLDPSRRNMDGVAGPGFGGFLPGHGACRDQVGPEPTVGPG